MIDIAWYDEAKLLLADLISLRRAIHQEPEIGLKTPMTSAKVRAALENLPLEWREGGSTTGLVGILRGAGRGRTVLLRGDMDALPMAEETCLPFASRIEGTMHACGHDCHTAMLAGAARLLCAHKERLEGDVLFMFQPGEEGWHGARHMLDDGLIDPAPDAAFALHVMPNAPYGVFGGRAGPLLASADVINIEITGRGGHASMPHDALDPTPVACEIVTAIQTFVTRQVSAFDPAVVTITSIQAGATSNVIPDSAHMIGTMRTLSPSTRRAVQEGLSKLVVGIAAAHGATATIAFDQGFPVTVCDERAARFGARVIGELLGENAWRTMEAPIMGAEDFSYILENTPGAMFFLGAAREGEDWRQCCGLHSSRMMIDESVMARGAAVLAAVADEFLRDGFPAT